MKTQKVKLKQLEVQSFVTLLDAKKLKRRRLSGSRIWHSKCLQRIWKPLLKPDRTNQPF